MSVSRHESRRDVAAARRWLALIVTALVLVAGVVVWRAGSWGPETRSKSADRAPPKVTTVRTVPSPVATLAEIAATTDDFTRNAALYRLAEAATQEQVENWLAELETLPPTRHRYDIARVLYIRFSVLHPDAALDHALQGATKPVWLEAIFRTWGEFDSDTALARASNLHPSAKEVASRALLQLRGSGGSVTELRSVAERLDETEDDDLYRAFEASHGVSAPTPAQRLLAEMEARRLARRDGESHVDAWNRAIGVEDPHVRHILAERTALDWAAEDPRAALAAVDSVPMEDMAVTVYGDGSVNVRPLRTRIRGSVIEKWAGDDPDATLAWILEQEGSSTGYYIQSPMIELTRRSPDDAIARLAAIPEDLRRSATGAVLRTIAYRDLDRALEWFATLDIDAKAGHTRTLRRLLMERRSAKDALGWAMSVDRRIRAREVPAVIRDVHDADRVEALRLLETIDDPALLTAAADSLVWGEVRHDAEQALAWARNFEPASARSELVVRVFDTWSRQDPAAAYRAISDQRGGAVRDQAAAAMMSDLVGHDAHLAERLFEMIEAPQQQARAAESLHRYFSDVEPDARKAERYRKHLPEDDGD